MAVKFYPMTIPSIKFLSNTNNNKNNQAIRMQTRQDCFVKSTTTNDKDEFSIISFMGKATLAAKAKQAGNMLLTKGINDYNTAMQKMNVPKEKYTQGLFEEISDLFEKVSNKFDSAGARLKLGLKESEYAQKANLMGNIYTQMGNVTGDPRYFQKAHDLFEDAAKISKNNLIKAQGEYQTYDANEQVLFNVLHPTPKKNPIGFQTDSSPQIAAKSETSTTGKHKMGF